MSSSERGADKASQQETLRQQFAQLRQRVHQSMRDEEQARLKDNPRPSEEELYMGAFEEWIEPQVRSAVRVMYRKGYATQSSGFHAERPELQIIDGYFAVDEKTRDVLRQTGVDVLRGADIGLPKNKLITVLRFRARSPSLSAIEDQWDAVAATLPEKSLPAGIRPICDRAEEFREQYGPEHSSLEEAREKYLEYLKRDAG